MTDNDQIFALKLSIRKRMLDLEEEELAVAVAHYENYLKEVALDDREGHDKDDIVSSRESADLAAAFDHPIVTHQAKIDVLEDTDFSPADEVRPGAVVSFNGRSFVVAVSTSRFDCGGVTYMGISTMSPIYKAIAGLQGGDEFEFNGRTFTLDQVL